MEREPSGRLAIVIAVSTIALPGLEPMRAVQAPEPSGGVLVTLEGHTGVVTACAVTPDGRYVPDLHDQALASSWPA